MEFLLIREEGKEKKYLIENRVVTIGRSGKNDITLKDRNSSRQHCNILKVGENWFVVDCESHNGTFVNNERIKKVEIKEGDRIAIGAVEIVFSRSASLPEAIPDYNKDDMQAEALALEKNESQEVPEELEREREQEFTTRKPEKPRSLHPTHHSIPKVKIPADDKAPVAAPAPSPAPPAAPVAPPSPVAVAAPVAPPSSLADPTVEMGNSQEDSKKKDLDKIRDLYQNFLSRLSFPEIGQEKFAKKFMIAMLSGAHCLVQGDGSIVFRILAPKIAAFWGMSHQIYSGACHEHLSANAHLLFLDRVSPDLACAHFCQQQPSMGSEKIPLPWMTVLCEKNPGEFSRLARDVFLFPAPLSPLTSEQEISLLQMSLRSQNPGKAALAAHQLPALQSLVEDVDLPDQVLEYTARLVRATRPQEEESPQIVKEKLSAGVGALVGVWILKAARARAAISGRDAVSIKDVQSVAQHLIPPRLDFKKSPEAGEASQLFRAIAQIKGNEE